MQHQDRFRLALLLVVALMSSACAASPAGGPSTPGASSPSGGDGCGPVLTAAEMEGGFLDGEIQQPTTGTVVEAVLATGGGNPQLTGKTILFRGAFSGPLPVGVDGGAMTAVEVGTSVVGTPECAGSVRIAVPSDFFLAPGKGEAFVEADLGPIHVGGGSIFCTALAPGTETIAVECPSLGIRIGDQATTGTLWLRFRSADKPLTATSLPDWVERVIGPASPTDTRPPGEPGEGTITVDGETFAIVGQDAYDFGVTVEPHDGVVRYRAAFSFGDVDWSQLSVEIPGYDGPGIRTTGAFVQVAQPIHGAFGSTYFTSTSCRVEVGIDELTGSVSCQLVGQSPEDGSLDIEAHWVLATVRQSVGPPVRVRWNIGGAYLSEGEATVFTSVNTLLDPSIRRVAEVLVGHAGTTDLLRIDIHGFTGDGTYTGDAVEVSLQNVFGDSPNLRANTPPATFVPGKVNQSDFFEGNHGDCTATVADDGRSGSVRCPHYPGKGGVTPDWSWTVVATWGPA